MDDQGSNFSRDGKRGRNPNQGSTWTRWGILPLSVLTCVRVQLLARNTAHSKPSAVWIQGTLLVV